jgi:two-component system OmpR family response regulator
MAETRDVPLFKHPLDGIRVLVVDDDPAAREVYALLLTLNGAEAFAVGSVSEAILTLERAGFDAVMSDVHMPDEDGFALVRRLRGLPDKACSALPAIAVTGDTDPTLAAQLRDAGFHARLNKPVRCGELVATLSDMVRGAAPGPRPALL